MLHLVGKVLVKGLIPHDTGMSLEIPISALGTSHMLRGVQNVFDVPVLSRKVWRTKLSSSHHTELVKRS